MPPPFTAKELGFTSPVGEGVGVGLGLGLGVGVGVGLGTGVGVGDETALSTGWVTNRSAACRAPLAAPGGRLAVNPTVTEPPTAKAEPQSNPVSV